MGEAAQSVCSKPSVKRAKRSRVAAPTMNSFGNGQRKYAAFPGNRGNIIYASTSSGKRIWNSRLKRVLVYRV